MAVLIDDSLRTRALDAAMDALEWQVTLRAHEAKVMVFETINDKLPLHLTIAASLTGAWLVTPQFVLARKGAAIKLKTSAQTRRQIYCTEKFQSERTELHAMLQSFQSNQFRLIASLAEFAVAKQQAEDRKASASVMAVLHDSEKSRFDGIKHCWTPEEFRDFIFRVDMEKSCHGK